ncbi:MAG: YdcF family protein [Pseudomonadota bacterium]
MKISRVRLSSIGGNGIKMLLLSVLVTVATGGLSLLAVQWHVWRSAVRSGTSPAACRQLLVLGMQLDRGRCREGYRQRLERGRQLLENRVGESLYLLGGITTSVGPSEAEAGRDYLLEAGCEPHCLVLEERSRHTLENLQRVRELLGDDMDCTIITSRYHLARTAAMAQGMGVKHQLCAAESKLPLRPGYMKDMLLEGVLLHWYFTGRYWARLVDDRASLERIS